MLPMHVSTQIFRVAKCRFQSGSQDRAGKPVPTVSNPRELPTGFVTVQRPNYLCFEAVSVS